MFCRKYRVYTKKIPTARRLRKIVSEGSTSSSAVSKETSCSPHGKKLTGGRWSREFPTPQSPSDGSTWVKPRAYILVYLIGPTQVATKSQCSVRKTAFGIKVLKFQWSKISFCMCALLAQVHFHSLNFILNLCKILYSQNFKKSQI